MPLTSGQRWWHNLTNQERREHQEKAARKNRKRILNAMDTGLDPLGLASSLPTNMTPTPPWKV